MNEGFENFERAPEQGGDGIDLDKALGEFAGSLKGLNDARFKSILPAGYPSAEEQRELVEAGDFEALFEALHWKIAMEDGEASGLSDDARLL